MPEYRFDPERRPALFPRIVQSVASFFANPLGSSFQGAADARTRTSVPRLPMPVIVNTDAATVTIPGARVATPDLPSYMTRAPRYIATSRGQELVAGRVQPLLQQALTSGTVPAGLPPGYRAVGAAIAGLSSQLTGNNMASAIIPPGGMASFIQQTPAAKLSMLGGRMRRKSKKRTKARKAAKSTRRTKRARKSGGRKLKFGSPAWQKKYKVGKYRR